MEDIMKFLAFPLVVLAVALSACSQVKDFNNSRHMEDEHNRLVDQANSESAFLLAFYSINLSPGSLVVYPDSEIKSKTWILYGKEQRGDIRVRIRSVMSKARRALEIENHKDIKDRKIKSNEAIFNNMMRRGHLYLQQLDSYEQSLLGRIDNTVGEVLKPKS
jgi:hypothetical protein